MIEWIPKVWKTYSLNFAGATYLILDWCLCYMTLSVMEEFAWLGTFIDFVQAGYTTVAQPIDIGINSPSRKYTRRCTTIGSLWQMNARSKQSLK